MYQAETGSTPDYAPMSGGIVNGKSHDLTRRALFGGAGALALAAIPAALVVEQASVGLDPRAVDRPFWAAVDAFKAAKARFEAEDDEAEWARLGDACDEAEDHMLRQRISTMSALLVMMLMVKDNLDRPFVGDVSRFEVMTWHAERLAKREMLA